MGKFSSMILLNRFSVPLSCISFLSYINIILRFSLLTVTHMSWIFHVKGLLDLRFSLVNDCISTSESSTTEILSSISCILWVILTSLVPNHLSSLSISSIPSFCVFFNFFYISFHAFNCFECFLQVFGCLCIRFFKRITYFLNICFFLLLL